MIENDQAVSAPSTTSRSPQPRISSRLPRQQRAGVGCAACLSARPIGSATRWRKDCGCWSSQGDHDRLWRCHDNGSYESQPRRRGLGSTVKRNNTTAATGGTPQTLHSDCFNVQIGYQIWWPPEMFMPMCPPSSRIVINIPETPGASMTMSGTLYFEEL